MKNKLKLILWGKNLELPMDYDNLEFDKYELNNKNGHYELLIYKNNKMIKEIKYWNNRNKFYEYNYKNEKYNGKIEGKCLFMWCNGKKMAEGKYKNRRKLGRWIYYKEDGEIDFYEYYKNGVLINEK